MSRVVIANYAAKADEKKVVVIIQGTWTLDKIQGIVKQGTAQKGLWKERVEEGIAIWERGEDVALFVPDRTVIFTNTAMAGQVIPLVTRMQGASLRQDSDIAEALPKETSSFVVVGKSIDLGPLGAYIPTLRQVRIDRLMLRFVLTKTLNAELKAVLKNDQQAAKIEQVLKVAIEKSRVQPVVRLLGFDQFLDAITLGRTGNTVNGKLILSEAQLKDLFTLIERFRGMQEAIEKSQEPAAPGGE